MQMFLFTWVVTTLELAQLAQKLHVVAVATLVVVLVVVLVFSPFPIYIHGFFSEKAQEKRAKQNVKLASDQKMTLTDQEKKTKKLWLKVLALFLIVVGLASYFSYDWYQEKSEGRTMSIVAYQKVVTDSSQAQLLFFKGGEVNKKEAVVFLKGKIAEEKQPNIKALFINQLLNFYYSDFDDEVYETIFSDGPLLKFKKENKQDSLLALATESNSLYPTSLALTRMSGWHAVRILDEKVTAEDKKKAADQVLLYMTEAEKLFLEKEIAEASLKIFGAQSPSKYYHLKASLLGAVSMVYQSRQKEMEESFQKAIDLYEKEPNNSFFLASLPYVHFYYAAFLSELEGGARRADIDREVKALILALDKNPSLHQNNFISFARLQSERVPENRDHNYKWLSTLAKNYSNFKKLLSSYNIYFEPGS